MKKYIPIVITGIFFLALVKFRVPISDHILDPASRVTLENLFAAIFDWSAIQTGFLFAVYGFVVGKADGFIGAIRKTPAMKRFTASLKKAIFAGFALTFVSMGLLLYPLKPIGWEYWVLSLWLSLFIWAFFLFCTVAHTFGVIVNVPDQEHPRGAG